MLDNEMRQRLYLFRVFIIYQRVSELISKIHSQETRAEAVPVFFDVFSDSFEPVLNFIFDAVFQSDSYLTGEREAVLSSLLL